MDYKRLTLTLLKEEIHLFNAALTLSIYSFIRFADNIKHPLSVPRPGPTESFPRECHGVNNSQAALPYQAVAIFNNTAIVNCGEKAMSYGQSKPGTATWLRPTLPHTIFTVPANSSFHMYSQKWQVKTRSRLLVI